MPSYVGTGINIAIDIANETGSRIPGGVGLAVDVTTTALSESSDGDFTPLDVAQGVGGVGGGAIGSYIGGGIGTAIAPGPGTVVGAAIGDVIGSAAGTGIVNGIAGLLGDQTHTQVNQAHVASDGTVLNQTFTNIGSRWENGVRVDIVHVSESGINRGQWTYTVPSWDDEKESLSNQNTATRGVDGSITVSSVNVNTGVASSTTYVESSNGGYVPSTTKTGGHVYAAGNVGVGQELNGADQVAHENHVRGTVATATNPTSSGGHIDPG